MMRITNKIASCILFLKKIMQSLWKKHKGAVLIEFAFAIPLLIIILYFGLDVPMAHRLSSKLYKVSELYAQMLINVTRNQYPHTLTQNNLKHISRIVGLVFTGVENTALQPFTLSNYIIAIRGTGGSSNKEFSVLWCIRVDNKLNDTGSAKVTVSRDDYTHSMIGDRGMKTYSGSIKNLIIQQNEIKILIETVANYNISNGARGFNSRLYLMTIPGRVVGGTRVFGDKTAIVTPLEGVITTTAPV
jgi:Flp pilus assembly protein TadG